MTQAASRLADRYLEQKGVPLASAQVQFSLLSKGPEQRETLRICQDLGICVIAYSPLGLGVLIARSLLPLQLPKSESACWARVSAGIWAEIVHRGAFGHPWRCCFAPDMAVLSSGARCRLT